MSNHQTTAATNIATELTAAEPAPKGSPEAEHDAGVRSVCDLYGSLPLDKAREGVLLLIKGSGFPPAFRSGAQRAERRIEARLRS